MKKLLLFTFVLLLLITTVSAETFKQNTVTDFKKTCTNSSDDVCDTTAYCNLTIKYPNSTYVVENLAMTNNNNGIFNYTIPAASINTLGRYTWDMFCCDNGCGESHGDFIVTKTGVELSQDKAIIYLGMMALLVFVFIVNFIGITLLPSKNTRDDNFILSINNLKYLRSVLMILEYGLLVTILFVAANISFLYLETSMMGNIFFKLFQILGWLLLPLFVLWFIHIFVMLYQDKELQRMIQRGVEV